MWRPEQLDAQVSSLSSSAVSLCLLSIWLGVGTSGHIFMKDGALINWTHRSDDLPCSIFYSLEGRSGSGVPCRWWRPEQLDAQAHLVGLVCLQCRRREPSAPKWRPVQHGPQLHVWLFCITHNWHTVGRVGRATARWCVPSLHMCWVCGDASKQKGWRIYSVTAL
jgi:hypothetical protein